MRRNQYIGLTVLALAVLLVIYKVRGQSFGSFNHDQPYLVGPVASSVTNIIDSCSGSLMFHLIASDIPTNGPVNTWTDRVGGLVFYQPTAGNKPLKTNGAVIFDGTSDFLICDTNFSGWNYLCYWIVCSFGSSANTKVLMGAPSQIVFDISYDYKWESTTTITLSQALPQDTIHDFYYFGQAIPNQLAFTNGVYSTTGGFLSATFNRLGYNEVNPSFFLQGRIYEIKIWTNCLAIQNQATNFAQALHQYVTTNYTYIP